MSTCIKCKKEIGFFGNLLAFNKNTQRCGSCEKFVQTELNKFRQTFINLYQDGVLSEQKIKNLYSQTQQANLNWQEALSFIRGDALHLLERYLTFVAADGIITDKEEQFFYQLQNTFQVPQNLAQSLTERLQYFKYVSKIRQGTLPNFRASTHLESDEICHLETPAIYNKINLRSVKLIQGRFIITNKKIHFLSSDGGWTILWKNVMRVQDESNGVYLELATKSGNGFYVVPDPLLTEAIINTVARMSKRQMLAPQTENQSRHIPQDVKNSVWQRDSGKCVQCKATSYLEFDHVIPFSKGGANTINNVQLLCRQCNLKKGSRL